MSSLELQAINNSTIWVTIQELQCKIKDTCDICLENYERLVNVKNYRAKFEILDEQYEEQDEIILNPDDEEIFPLNPKTENINIEDFLVHTITLKTPFTKRCPSCEKKHQEQDEANDEEYSSEGGNISFH
ncbi:MAG: hypothetical protein GXP45_03910 [bacterium]|nr:hypothetical protein [bacterium]